jgi:hypothetical protein
VTGDNQEAEVPILARRTTNSLVYRQGERVSFSAAEFSEIAFACNFFADDLASKLPVLPDEVPVG